MDNVIVGVLQILVVIPLFGNSAECPYVVTLSVMMDVSGITIVARIVLVTVGTKVV